MKDEGIQACPDFMETEEKDFDGITPLSKSKRPPLVKNANMPFAYMP